MSGPQWKARAEYPGKKQIRKPKQPDQVKQERWTQKEAKEELSSLSDLQEVGLRRVLEE